MRQRRLKVKYEIEFINKLQDGVQRNLILIFGKDDIKAVAEKCFKYGASGQFSDIKFKRIKGESDE